MDYQTPDPQNGSPLGRVEEDLERPLRAAKSISHRRLPAALPFAIAGILVVTSVAFGATVVRQLVTPTASATPVVVGDDDPTDAPTDAPSLVPSQTVTEAPVITEAPVVTEAPTQATITLTGALDGAKVALSWTKFQGEGFAYYKVVRSTDAIPTWPLGSGDTLVAAIDGINTLSFLDTAPAGKALHYAVFAVTSADSSYTVLATSNVVTVTTPAATPRPTATCYIHLTATLVPLSASTSGGAVPATAGYRTVRLSWNKWGCDGFQYYGVVKVEAPGTPTLPLGTVPGWYSDGINTLTTDIHVGYGKTWNFRAWVFNDNVAAVSGGAVQACNANTILAVSNVVTVVVPAPATPAPPTDAPSAPAESPVS